MKAQIVIPSYKRVQQLKDKTLAMLRSYDIQTIFARYM